jgi:hypothetical protein
VSQIQQVFGTKNGFVNRFFPYPTTTWKIHLERRRSVIDAGVQAARARRSEHFSQGIDAEPPSRIITKLSTVASIAFGKTVFFLLRNVRSYPVN